MQKGFDLFFKGRKKIDQASAVFSILVNCLNPKNFNLVDLTMQFNSQTGPKKVSIVDHVNNLLDSNPKQRPGPSHLVLHNYIRYQSQMTNPQCFYMNT